MHEQKQSATFGRMTSVGLADWQGRTIRKIIIGTREVTTLVGAVNLVTR
jgi:hypothetical protein